METSQGKHDAPNSVYSRPHRHLARKLAKTNVCTCMPKARAPAAIADCARDEKEERLRPNGLQSKKPAPEGAGFSQALRALPVRALGKAIYVTPA